MEQADHVGVRVNGNTVALVRRYGNMLQCIKPVDFLKEVDYTMVKKNLTKNLKAVIFTAILCSMLSFTASSALAAPKEKTKADPSTTATWSGKGGKESGRENFMGWCINCHGEKGKGDGPLSTTLGQGIKPRNLTDAKLLSTRTDEFLFKVIRNGGASVGFSEAMMPHKDMLSDDEIKNVILFIRSDICKCKYQGSGK